MKDRPEEQPAQEAGGEQASAGQSNGPVGAQPQEAAPADGAESTPEVDALRERYLRLAAEYDNFRKRTERERAELTVRAQAQLMERVLDVLDDLQRVAHYNADTTTVAALLEGVQMVERKFLRVLEGAGLEAIEPRGRPFDPAQHEALMTAPTENREEDESVGEVLQKGYQFKGVLLRPARVQVRKYG
jgi:molecular chaperone GrpE